MNAPTLAGKTALITGASRGIGFAITHSLARNGVHCILLGRDARTLDAQVKKLPCGKHSYIVADVTDAYTWTELESQNVPSLQYETNSRD
jgi:NAD(P)-dependent dehydrogenase (short-subunit alcohol dehydrogenase family)